MASVTNFKFITYTKENERVQKQTHDYMSGKKVALLFVPGAFTPTCNKHIQELAQKINKATVLVVVPNDCDVVRGWREHILKDTDYKLILVADPELKFITQCEGLMDDDKMKLTFEPGEARGLGSKRPARVAMIVDDLKVTQVFYDVKNLEAGGCAIDNAVYFSTGADNVLKLLGNN